MTRGNSAPAALDVALRAYDRAKARQLAELHVVYKEMRQARREGASITDVAEWTGYSRRHVVDVTGHVR